MKKTILITGGAGFLGSHLCDRFIKEGFRVLALDNLSTGNLRNIEHLFPLKDFELYHEDVTEFIHIPERLDYILHFASPSLADYAIDPVKALQSSALGVHNCLHLARRKGARILIASTSDVYSEKLEGAVPEEDWGKASPMEATGMYREARRYMESITMAFHLYQKTETRVARIFSTYGPRMRPDPLFAPSYWMEAALRGEELAAATTDRMNLCWVDDVVEGIYRLLLSDCCLPVNLGSAEHHPAMEIAERIHLLSGHQGKLAVHTVKADRVNEHLPDLTRAMQMLAWHPVGNLSEGLALTCAYFRTLYAEKGFASETGYRTTEIQNSSVAFLQ